ncbi:adenylate kinase [bacterium]|nr:adenylate kinase [bacterium]
MHKYVIMGAQGCGKGTQAKLLAERFDLVHISVGDIFRWNIQNHTKLAARIKRCVDAGELVGDDIVAQIVHARLAEHDWNFGFILDGFPRNHTQATFFLESYDIDAVIHVAVSDDVVKQRIMSRRLCQRCGLDYNLIHHRPEVPDRCDVCGGELVTRDDDNEEAVEGRLRDYREQTEPVLDLFARKELIVTVDGTESVEAVHQAILTALGHAWPPPSRPDDARG